MATAIDAVAVALNGGRGHRARRHGAKKKRRWRAALESSE
jgi:hypothetical protein